ncbi:MAG: PHP domain-containing protein [Clostridiales Family XIII bacterium]|nr:PHP domain-containing protein [Clostridiales Family XIII bacterium]
MATTSTYRLLYDWHTHTTFSHGLGSIADNVRAAARRGLLGVGITDHGPGHLFYGFKRARFAEMRGEIEAIKAQNPGLAVYMGIEANIVDASGRLDLSPAEFALFDYVIAGYHYGAFGGNPLALGLLHAENALSDTVGFSSKRLLIRNTEMTEKALYANDLKMLTHPGDKGPADLFAVARACAETNTLFEINARHKALTAEGLRAAARTEVKFAVSSDAHSPKRVGETAHAIALIREAGLDVARVVNLSND